MSILKKLGNIFEAGTDEFIPVKTEGTVPEEAVTEVDREGKTKDPTKPYFEGDDVLTDPELVGPSDYEIEQAKKAQNIN